MIESSLIGAVSRISAIVAIALAGLAVIAGYPAAAIGLAAGVAMGLVPLVTWAWMIGPMLRGGSVWLVVILMIGKLALYGGALWLLVAQKRVDGLSFGAGVLLPGFVIAAVALQRTPARAGGRA